MPTFAEALDGIPMVADATVRDARFPLATRAQNQRVFRLDTGVTERWSGSAWLAETVQSFNPKRFGAVGDGTTDDTTALQACYDAAYAAAGVGAVVWIPSGVFRIGTVYAKCHTAGVGTIKAKSGNTTQYETLTVPNATLVPGFPGGVTIRGITLDGNLAGAGPGDGTYTGTRGLVVYGDDTTLLNVTVKNAFKGGITAYQAARLKVLACRVSTVRGVFGDGIFCGGCTDPLLADNSVTDVTRSGVVVDADSGVHSTNPIIARNQVTTAANKGGTEFNAGIWVENTEGHIQLAHNRTRATGDYGYVIAPAPTTRAQVSLVGNAVDTATTGIALSGGTTAPVAMLVQGGGVMGVSSIGVSVGSMAGTVTIDRVHFGPMTFATNSSGLVVVDLAPGVAAVIPSLEIVGCTKETNTYTATESGDINIVSNGGRLTDLNISQLQGDWTIAQAVAIGTYAITQSRVTPRGTGAPRLLPSSYQQIQTLRTATASPVTVTQTDCLVLTNLSVAGAVAVSIPAFSSVPLGHRVLVKDAKGDAAANNITITPVSGLIDGAGTAVISANYGRVLLVAGPTQWNRMD